MRALLIVELFSSSSTAVVVIPIPPSRSRLTAGRSRRRGDHRSGKGPARGHRILLAAACLTFVALESGGGRIHARAIEEARKLAEGGIRSIVAVLAPHLAAANNRLGRRGAPLHADGRAGERGRSRRGYRESVISPPSRRARCHGAILLYAPAGERGENRTFLVEEALRSGGVVVDVLRIHLTS